MWFLTWCILFPAVLSQADLTINPNNNDNGLKGQDVASSVQIDLSKFLNNRAFAMSPGDADFDGAKSGYPAQVLPPQDFTYVGVHFDFPQYKEAGSDNLLAQGQVIYPERGRYLSVHMLAAAEAAVATGTVQAFYANNSHNRQPGPGRSVVGLALPSVDYNRSMIFHTVTWLDSSQELTSLRLPNVTSGASNGPGGAAEKTRLHIFAVSLVPAGERGTKLEIQEARSTKQWFEGTNKTQIIQVSINNAGNQWIFANHSIKITIEAPGLKTVQPGVINRLRPGDQAKVEVGVVNAEGFAVGTKGPASVNVSGAGISVSSNFNATYGIPEYEATFDSIYSHESPPWYSNAKYGIFIHWGVYAVPGWGNVGKNETYAEWYWWDMNQGPDTPARMYEHNLATYGPNHAYDDFIQNFTASAFNPKEWVDLFADAGAKYFVQTSKHHDGYAIFDLPSHVTNRTSVAQHQPQLHRATYFSLPEWFHPDYKKYGFGSWPGGNATNPYTNESLPYTGYVPVSDYVQDVILPEMLALATMGTEIMWCDIGGPNLTAQFAAEFFNSNAQSGRQVALNNRCGLPGDFDTPEYARYDSAQLRKWESNLGMDPDSYGYNRATPASAYLAPRDIVTSLVDIVSKNGNLLLDVGPMADGTIIQVEQDNLRAAGAWIKSHGEAIYNTTYWFVTPQEGDAVRFTQTPDAFYILTLTAPNSTLVLDSPVPFVSGDCVTVVGGEREGEVVPSRLLSNGSLELVISEDVIGADHYSWVFKIPFV